MSDKSVWGYLNDVPVFHALREVLGLCPLPPEAPSSATELALRSLRAGPTTFAELARRMNRSKPQVSRVVKRLRQAGLVRNRGAGLLEVVE